MTNSLTLLNADFREPWREYQEAMMPRIQRFRSGQGPFKEDALRVKQVRFLKKI